MSEQTLVEMRWIRKASALRACLEQMDRHVEHEVRIRRMVQVTYFDTVQHRTQEARFTRLQFKIMVAGRAANIRIKRFWHVYAGSVVYNRWERLVLAQAERDGLNYHYARWLMTQDTRAAGL